MLYCSGVQIFVTSVVCGIITKIKAKLVKICTQNLCVKQIHHVLSVNVWIRTDCILPVSQKF